MSKAIVAMALAMALVPGDRAHAAALPVEVTLELGVAFNGSTVLPGEETVAMGAGVAQVNGSGPAGGALAQLALPADLVATTGFTSAVTDPLRFPELGRQLTVGHGAGAFAAGPGGFGGVMALDGLLRLCLFAACGSGPPGNLSIPLSVVGVGGTAMHGGALNVTVTGGPWTTGMVALWQGGAQFETGFVHGAASGTTSVAAPGGVVQLVAPMYLSTNRGPDALVPAIARLRLAFVPEPGIAASLGLGLAVLAAAGSRRRRR